MAAPSDIPEAASRRLSGGAFTSALTVPDFAATLQMGMEPVGLVQGFCVMQWGWYGMGSPYLRGVNPVGGQRGQYSESWQCPHGFVSNDHRTWGQNYEQPWVEAAWGQGFGTAYTRMVEEATAIGAHGIIGVIDSSEPLGDMGVIEFHIRGTAVKVTGGPPPPGGKPWTTYLAGQRLAKLIEAGYVPVSIAAAVSSVRVWAYCVTEYLMEVVGPAWRDRATFYLNHSPASIAENNFVAIRKLCSNPESIIVTVDADDRLIGTGALFRVSQAYQHGADATVGSMLRTDKEVTYPVTFQNARFTRGGGNVWQHLRTFRKRLFDRLREADLKIEGEWVEDAEDWAYMLPVVEMAEHPVRITDRVYWYEPSPGKSLRKRELREAIVANIVAKPPYGRGS